MTIIIIFVTDVKSLRVLARRDYSQAEADADDAFNKRLYVLVDERQSRLETLGELSRKSKDGACGINECGVYCVVSFYVVLSLC